MPATTIIFLLVALPAFLLFSWVHRGSVRRLVRIEGGTVDAMLLAESRQQENEIREEAIREKLAAVRECERRVYGKVTGKGARRPSELAVMDLDESTEAVARLAERVEAIDLRTEERREEFQRTFDARREELLAVVRRGKTRDRIFAVTAWVGETWVLVLTVYVLYTFFA
ncbi:hypothetical protein [Nocardiopsis alborubida]|uniref:Uncharacterized protein n=1 Tax=Nocardiopsis alborubida TaxID=146802 RepID=A0A7X6MF15_9ACTN|nr:hypothetical protein [Nocardiopsis alborubida]NKY99364.1 hypothetical protein [Nocardiopsis alborubida]